MSGARAWASQRTTLLGPWTCLPCCAQDSYDRINSLDFHRTEDLLVTGSDDDSIRVYNTSNAQAELKLPSKKYGVCHVRYTHNPNCVVYSTPEHKVREPCLLVRNAYS